VETEFDENFSVFQQSLSNIRMEEHDDTNTQISNSRPVFRRARQNLKTRRVKTRERPNEIKGFVAI
jgi:hypothetical protein